MLQEILRQPLISPISSEVYVIDARQHKHKYTDGYKYLDCSQITMKSIGEFLNHSIKIEIASTAEDGSV